MGNSRRIISKRRWIAFGVSVTIILLLSRYALIINNTPAWAFDGAYVNYYGGGAFVDDTPFTVNITVRVISHTWDSAELNINWTTTWASGMAHNQTTVWVGFGSPTNPFSPETRPTSTQDATIKLNGKNVSVTALVYQNSVIYDSKSVHFPVALMAHARDGSNYTTNTAKTNIRGLLP